jgi:hypothetical protein
MKFIITQEDAQKILDHLTLHPYKEVYQLVPIFQNMERVIEPEMTPTLVKEEKETSIEED